MAKNCSALLLPIFALFFLLSPAIASDAYVLQTGELSINSWHFHYSRHTFSVTDPGFATLTVTKITPDKSISRGFLFMNRRAVPLKRFFRGDDPVFEKKIKLKDFNRLNVFLWGTPGAKIKIDIRRHDAPEPPPTITFGANPLTITLGESSTLSWETNNADTVTIDQGIGDVPVSGTIEVVPVETTTYTLTAAGAGGTSTAQVTVTVNPLPPTVTLAADPETIVVGNSAVLSWSSDYANSCVIEPDIGVVELNGSITVTPAQTTTYRIIATGDGGESSAEATVTVTDPAPTVNITAADATIILGQSTTLSWTSTHADACTIEPGIGTVNPSGSVEVTPTETTTYTVTATGSGGSATDQVTVAVEYPVPVVTFSASPSSVLLGQASTLSWTTTNADTVEIDQNIGTVDLSGSQSVSPNTTTTYTLTATGPGGTTTSEVTVTVTYPQPSVTLQIDPDTIVIGETTTLSWTSLNAVSVSIDQGIGNVASDGEMSISPTASATYTITATGVGGDTVSASASVTVTIPEPVVSFLADPETILSGSSSTLTWNTSYADTVTIEPDLGTVAASGSQTVSPTQSTTYTLTATGPSGTTVESVTVTVLHPPTATLSATPATIEAGNEATLAWETTNADTVTIDQEIGSVAASGSVQVAPETSTTYTLTATGAGGSTSAQATVTVNHPPVAEIAATPNPINPGDPVTLSWSTSYADTVTIDQDIGTVDANGSMTVNPMQNTTYTITATGPGGTTTASETIRMIVSEPSISFSSTSNEIVLGDSIVLTWEVTNADTVTIEPGIGSVAASGSTDVTPTGDTTYTLIANGPGGLSEARISVTVHDLTAGPVVFFEQSEISIAQGDTATLTWSSTGADTAYIDNGIGSTTVSGSVSVQPQSTTIYTLTVTGTTGTSSAQAVVHVTGSPSLQPEGSFGFLYNDLIPADATVDAYDERRFAVITGLVHDVNGNALEEVTVTILGHPEYGSAKTDGQGRFAIPVEGGTAMVVVFRKSGFISSQRQVEVPWNDVAVVDTFQMIVEDSAATTITFDGNPATVFTHRSTPLTDDAGTRSTTLVFAGDNMAYAVDADGNDMHALPTIITRATEYATAESMPAELPPNSGYTYCAELSVSGAQRVRFDDPVIMWVDNFLDFPVGEAVPVGYYDRDRGLWVPSENGAVVRLLDTDSDGSVDGLDADGDGAADDLDNDGTFTSEVTGLTDSQRYPPGATFWRAEVTHFSSWDCNWPFGPPEDAQWPDPTLAADYSVEDCQQWPHPEISVRARIVSKEIPIPGTDMALHYASNRSDGYSVVFEIEASHDEVPLTLEEIEVKLRIAGQLIYRRFPGLRVQRATMVWNGRNFRGDKISSRGVAAKISVGFMYQGVYNRAARGSFAFGRPNNEPIEGDRTRGTITLSNETNVDVTTATRLQKDIAQGWNLDIHHLAIDSDRPKLIKGDGGLLQRFSSNYAYSYLTVAGVIHTVAGGGNGGDGGPATEAQLGAPRSVVFDAVGNMYILDVSSNSVRKVDSDGIITTFAGGAVPDDGDDGYGDDGYGDDGYGDDGYGDYDNGDGGPAELAELLNPLDIAIDPFGNIYIADTYHNCIRKVDTDGIITTIAATGGYDQGPPEQPLPSEIIGDGGPAVDAILQHPYGVATDRYGNVYIADTYNYRIRMVDTAGMIHTIAGTGTPGYAVNGAPAVDSPIFRPMDLIVDEDQNVYLLTLEQSEIPTVWIQKIDNQGMINTIYSCYAYSRGFEIDSDGNIYLTNIWNNTIEKIIPNQSQIVIAGNGDSSTDPFNDGQAATQVPLGGLEGVEFGPDGLLYIARAGRVHRISEAVPVVVHETLKERVFTDAEGLGYVISDDTSLHMRTIDLHTGRDVYVFGYDEQQNLLSVTDRFGQRTEIQRDANGTPLAIVAPNGLRTDLTVSEKNQLTAVTLPGADPYKFEYTDEGLMYLSAEPSGDVTRYSYDDYGRVKRVKDSVNGEWQYEKSGQIDEELVTRVITPEGNRTTYRDVSEFGHLKSSVVTDANGSRVQYERLESGTAGEPTVRKTLQCDTQMIYAYGFDPNYGYAYLRSVEEVAPSLLRRTFGYETEYLDSSGDDVADVVVSRTNMNGHQPSTIEHDTLASTRSATSPEGRTAVASYNPDTLLVENISIPGLHDTFFGYDGTGHLTSIQSHTRQRTFGYSAQGFLESVTEMPNRITSFTHDAAGRIETMTPPNSNPLSFDYDADGNMTVISNPLGTHGLAYDAGNLATAYQTPASGSYVYLYDQDRNLVQIDFPSGIHIYSHYDQGVLQQIHTPEGNIDFAYAPACDNKIDAISKGAEAIHFGFDGPMLTTETIAGTLNQTLEYEYSDDFNVSGFTYAGQTQINVYDLDGLLINTGPFTITRNLQNGLPEVLTGGGLDITRSFNRFGEIESQVVNVGVQEVAGWTLTWEDSGQIGNKTESIGGVSHAYVYAYDDVGRLESVRRDDVEVARYTYDANGVRQSETNLLRGIADRAFAFSPEHQVMTAGSTVYAYDLDGFLTTKTEGSDITTYDYASRGELLSVTLPDGRVISYIYDPLGRRIAKLIDAAVVEKYLWYGQNKLLAVFDGSDNLLQRFEYADDRMPVSMTQQGSTYFMAYDPTGSVRLVTDASGNTVKQMDYDPFGYVLQDSNPSFSLPLGFGGGLYDADTGLVRFGRRDYDPDVGRWTFKDPDLFAGGDTDLYGYVKNDPVNFIHDGNRGSSLWGGYGAAWGYGSSGMLSKVMLPEVKVAQSVLFGQGLNEHPVGRSFAGTVEGGLFARVNQQHRQYMADAQPCRGIQWTGLSDYLFSSLFGGFYSGMGTPVEQILPNSTRNVTQIPVQPGESIQDAINLALDGDEVVLADGVHTLPSDADHLDFGGKDIILRSANGPANCIIDLENSKSGFRFYQAETEETKVIGLTIMNGAGEFGGALMCYQASPTIQDCIFINNQGVRGGAIYVAESDPLLINCTIVKNTATGSGFAGGGIYVNNGSPQIINCTVADNTAPNGRAGGLYSLSDGATHDARIISSVFWNNSERSGLSQIQYNSVSIGGYQSYSDPPDVGHSDVQGGFNGTGNIDADPRFVDTAADDYHLQSDSACIDAGSSEGALDHDIDGDARPRGWYDMGSDETSVITGTTFIQQLIDEAYDGDVVLVPPGTYGVGNRNLDFKGKAITLRAAGGAGGVVIDVGGMGRGVVFTSGEGPDSVLDGFTIKNGRADTGGGVYIENASPTLVNCTIVKNTATGVPVGGGGIYVKDGSPRIINCTVADNAVSNGFGGGLYSESSDNVHGTQILSSVFWGNTSYPGIGQIAANKNYQNFSMPGRPVPLQVGYTDIQGGYSGAGNMDADPRFVDTAADDYHLQSDSPCIDAGSSEGAPDHDIDGDARPRGWYDMGSDETAVITGTTFIQQLIDEAYDGDVVLVPPGTYGVGNRNLDFKGKAITLRAAGGVVIDAGGMGRGVVFTSGEGPDSVLDGFTIKNGRADNGGGVYIENASPTLVNCTIVKNTATSRWGEGGGIYVKDGSPRIINCTVADNAAPNGYGAGLHSQSSDNVHGTRILSSVFWGNTSRLGIGQMAANKNYQNFSTPQMPVPLQVGYSDIQGGYSGDGNIDANPRFVNTAADDYHLQSGSACIDAGSSEGAPDHDIDGDARPRGWYDMGSDETGVITGTTFIQQLIDNAADGDVVLVPPGTYGVGNRNLDFKGKAITLRAAGGAGGVVIDVGGMGRGVVFTSGEGPDAVLDGFTIKNGRADMGGGVYIENASPTLVNCTIVKNTAIGRWGEGGGIYVHNGSPRIINCTVADNAAPNGFGAGLHSQSSNNVHGTQILSSVFWGNTSRIVIVDAGQIAANRNYQNVSTPQRPVPLQVGYTDIQGGYSGDGNIDADPHFVNTAADDYHLQTSSPCIDVGNMSAVAIQDLDGHGRPQRWYEMGSDELYGVLPDYWELQFFGTTNVDSHADADGDGLTNIQEYLLFCADPTNPDSDGDGISDGDEFNAGTSLCTSDADGDGMTDDWEISHGLNPMYNDAGGDPDGDGLTNLVEYTWRCLHPFNPDTDGDTLNDGEEDANANGVRDGSETHPCDPDTDGDGMPDNWELDNGLDPNVADAAGDPDSDGLPNIAEYQWGCLSPHNWDVDHDGIADGAEDSNQNGVLDNGETHPCNADSDGDGVSDGCQADIDPYPPVITLAGDSTVSICQDEAYVDRGATAVDNCDGDVTAGIAVDNPVNPSVPGVYVVTYTVADAHGNAAVPATRTVVVLGADDTVQIDTTYRYDDIGRLRRITKQAQ